MSAEDETTGSSPEEPADAKEWDGVPGKLKYLER